ncbi:DNA cytosine methyltransferase [Cupriavidus sp. IK-TO18]|nr:DNA cytosine methyltransferase [Cupriavidus sp. IK-TO18]
MPLRFGSVCSGIEAASVAWHPLGWRAAWLAEIELFPSTVLAHHYPTVPNLGDMTKLARMVLAGEIEAPDVLVGGTPCQAYSVAGMRAGLNDERGQLTLRYMELADAIDFVRQRDGKPPVVIVWENVPGVLSDKTNAFGCFLAGLAGEDVELQPAGKRWTNAGCVFGPQRAVAWRTLGAQYFGLAQRRRRVFVVASARDGFDPTQVLFEWDGVRRDSAPCRESRKNVAPTLSARTKGGGGLGTDFDLDGGLVAGTLQASGKAAGSATQQDAEAGLLITQCVTGDVTHALKAEGADASEDGTGRGNPIVPVAIQAGALRTNPASGPDGVGVQESIAYTLEARAEVQAVAFSCKDYGNDAQYGVAPTMRAMGHSGSHANAGGQLAVAFDTTQITSAANRSNPQAGDPCHPLAAGAHPPALAYTTKLHNTKSNNAGKLFEERTPCLDANSPAPALLTALQVRRLTPRECERLQGFPDDYTLVPVRNKPAADGPRYKALGNSMAVPVMAWIGLRISFAIRSSAC